MPQGSVLAPLLFNVYISDMPGTTSEQLGYADDWVIAHQHNKMEVLEHVLSDDMTDLKAYFDRWYLRMNRSKTVSSVFHLNSQKADTQLIVQVDGHPLPADPRPKYLGVTLDRTLTYKSHIKGISRKVEKRNCLLRKLAGTKWGAAPAVLRTSALALSYSAAEYACPVFERSAHIDKLDVKLRGSMRIISGCLMPTQNEWLPVMSAIEPPDARRKRQTQKWVKRVQENRKAILPLELASRKVPAAPRLKSRRPFSVSLSRGDGASEAWDVWFRRPPWGAEVVSCPGSRLPGFDNAGRRRWVACNRIRSRVCRTAATLHQWNPNVPDRCRFCGGTEKQTVDHLVLQCPVTRFEGGYERIHECEADLETWLSKHGLEL